MTEFEIQLKLDEAIDALNEGGSTAPADDELADLVDLACALRGVPHAEWPNPAFSDHLAANLARELRPRRVGTRRRWSIGVAALAACTVVFLVVISLNRASPVDATTLAREVVAVSQGEGTGAISFTQVITNRVPRGVFEPTPPPPRVIEHVAFAAPDRWRVEATITEPDGAGTTTVLTIRNGPTIVAVRDSSSQGKTETRYRGGVAAGLPSAASYGSQVDALTLLQQTKGSCARALYPVHDGPSIDGRATQVLRLGASPCPSAAMPELNGPAVFVVDRRTHLVLKAELHSAGGEITQRVRTIADATSVPLSARLFRLPTPPATATHQTRHGFTFAPQLPTDLPGGVRAGRVAPVATQASTGKTLAFTITYSAGGRALLQLYEAAVGTPSVRYPGRRVLIRPGLVGIYVKRGRVAILWWTNRGAYVSLQQGGSSGGVELVGRYPLSELVRIARSTGA